MPKPESGYYALVMLRASDGIKQACAQDPSIFASTMVDGDFVAITSSSDATEVAEALVNSQDDGAQAAVSLPFESTDELPVQGKLVRYCFDQNDTTPVISASNHTLSFLVYKIGDSRRFKSLAHPALAKLAAYDKKNHSDLYNTLRVYLDNDRNAQKCANALYLHRNSLQYRVKRIQEITGVNLGDPEERLYLRLSFLLRAVEEKI